MLQIWCSRWYKVSPYNSKSATIDRDGNNACKRARADWLRERLCSQEYM